MISYAMNLAKSKTLTKVSCSIICAPLPKPALFHSSQLALMGRKGGSKALEAPPRPFSKKQMKRRAQFLEKRNETQTNHSVDKIKLDHMKKELTSDATKEYISRIGASLDNSIEDLLLPNGSNQTSSKLTLPPIDPAKIMRRLSALQKESADIIDTLGDAETEGSSTTLLNSGSSSGSNKNNALVGDAVKGKSIVNTKSRQGIASQANAVLIQLSKSFKQQDVQTADEILSLMNSVGLEVQPHVLPALMKQKTKTGKFEEVDALFDSMVKRADTVPTGTAWTAKISNLAKSGRPDEALQLIDQLLKTRSPVNVLMFNTVLSAYIRSHNFDAAYKLWERMHMEEIELDKYSFAAIIHYCKLKGQPERAFFYMDEMRSLGLQPDLYIFERLFDACSTAPHWVNGYSDIIFDAMCIMEGMELVPTTRIYNNIIRAFACAGDSVAAEFYFWELTRKGLKPSTDTFINLLNAYARSQSVGAKRYGTLGRYVRPAPRALTDEEKDYRRLGVDRVASTISSGVTEEVERFKGKRTRSRLVDMLDEHPETSSSLFKDELRADSAMTMMGEDEQTGSSSSSSWKNSKNSRNRNQSSEVDSIPQMNSLSETEMEWEDIMGDDNVDIEELLKGDPQLQALVKELRMEDPTALDQAIREVNSPSFSGDLSDFEDLNIAELQEQLDALSDDGDDDDDGEEDDDDYDEEEHQMIDVTKSAEKHDVYAKIASADARETLNFEASVKNTLKTIEFANSFYDPFEKHMSEGIKGLEVKALRENGGRLAGLGGNNPTASDEEAEKQLHSTLGILDAGRELVEEEVENQMQKRRQQQSRSAVNKKQEEEEEEDDDEGDRILQQLLRGDDGEDGNSELSVDDDGCTAVVDLASSWDMIEFGRAPQPDYSQHITLRRKQNQKRASLALGYMIKNTDLKPTAKVISQLVAVHAECGHTEGALKAFDMFEKYDLQPNAHTYRSLVKMHVLAKDLPAAQALKDQVRKDLNIRPDAQTYGILIESQAHSNLIVEALQNLEEATDAKIRIPDRHIKKLRSRCKNLGIVHPDMPPDPVAWVQVTKDTRRRHKNSSQRKIEAVRSALR